MPRGIVKEYHLRESKSIIHEKYKNHKGTGRIHHISSSGARSHFRVVIFLCFFPGALVVDAGAVLSVNFRWSSPRRAFSMSASLLLRMWLVAESVLGRVFFLDLDFFGD
jgi:hypothetical protein